MFVDQASKLSSNFHETSIDNTPSSQRNLQLKQIDCRQQSVVSEPTIHEGQVTSIQKKQKKKLSPYFWACISLVLTIITYSIYQSLKVHCPYPSQGNCLKSFIMPNLNQWAIKIILNCIIGTIQFHFLVKGTTFRIIPLTCILGMFCLYVFSDQTTSDTYYIGAINMAHLLILTILIILYSIIKVFLVCFRKKRTLFYATNFLIVLLVVIFFSYAHRQSCDYWQKGINGKIEKVDGVCDIKTPSICWYKILDGHLGLTWLFNDCYFGQKGKKKFDKLFSEAKKSGDFISFPKPYNYTWLELCEQNIQKAVADHAKGFKTLEEAKKSPEKPDIVFDSENQIYYIDVQRNESLVRQRAEIWQKNQLSDSPSLVKSVLFIYVDTISRQSMHLKIPKLVKWFENQAIYQSYLQNQDRSPSKNEAQNNKKSQGQAYQFYRYNSIKHWTQPNIYTMFYGVDVVEVVKNGKLAQYHEQPSIITQINERGYITGSANTCCQVISSDPRLELNNSFQSSKFDHQSLSYGCDPNFNDPLSIHSLVNGQSSSGTRCLYGKLLSEYAAEYTLSFFQKYKDQPKFFSLQFSESHQTTGQGANLLNEPLSKMIQTLDKKGHLQDTLVMLLSDHGMHMHLLLQSIGTQNYSTEINLPGLMVRLPSEMNKRYRDSIRKNQQYVVTSYNVHHFLRHIVEGDKYEGKKQSLLSDLRDNTSCQKVGIKNSQYCSCK